MADRIAQTVAKIYFEPLVEPHFHADSYGYRPRKSPLDAVEITRKRCWQYNWVLEFDIVGLFDNIDHELLMRAVKKHTDSEWIILYVERWLKAPFKLKMEPSWKERAEPPKVAYAKLCISHLML